MPRPISPPGRGHIGGSFNPLLRSPDLMGRLPEGHPLPLAALPLRATAA